MAQGGYSGQRPSAEQVQERAEANRQADERIKQQMQDEVNKRVCETAERYELELAALRTKLASTEAERASLLRILDAYAAAMSALQAQVGGGTT